MYFQEDQIRIKNVFLYIRQSTDEDEKKQVRSLLDQKMVCEEFAIKLGLCIVETFREDKSAKRPHNRPVFKAMLKELQYKNPDRRRADGILAWHPDRLSRNALEAGMIVQMLDDEQIKDMFFPAYSFHNDASGKEHLFIEFARAKGYSDHLSVSVSRGSQGREREGAMIHSPKFGYIKKREIPEKPALCSLFPIPCPKTFPIVQRIFELRAERYSLSDIEVILREEGLQPDSGKLGKSRIAHIVTDPFYCGKWTIKRGTKEERVIDFTTLTAPDGTPFTPVLSESAFIACQQTNTSRSTSHSHKGKHINPIPVPIICERCQKNMRPCWKAIKRAGGKIEQQLGYECQTIDQTGTRCKQPRIKADLLYGHIAEALQNVTVHKRHYHRFLIGAERFIRQRTADIKQQRITQSKIINKLKQKKLSLLQQMAVLSEKTDVQDSDIAFLNDEVLQISKELQGAEEKRRTLDGDQQQKIIRFRKFIELSQSLHQQWLRADLAQKQKISEKILLNLHVEDRKIRSQTWKKPFQEWLEMGNFPDGTLQYTELEPYFTRLERLLNETHWSTDDPEWFFPEKDASYALSYT